MLAREESNTENGWGHDLPNIFISSAVPRKFVSLSARKNKIKMNRIGNILEKVGNPCFDLGSPSVCTD